MTNPIEVLEAFEEALANDLLDTEIITVVRHNGQIIDYVLEGEPVRPDEILSQESLEAVMAELRQAEKD